MELLTLAQKLLDDLREVTAQAEQCAAKYNDPSLSAQERERYYAKEFNLLMDSAAIHEDILDITSDMRDNVTARNIEKQARQLMKVGIIDVN